MIDEEGATRCPNCDSSAVQASMVMDRFPYGTGPNPVTLEAEVQAFECVDCSQSWTGEQGEAARTAAVNAYLLTLVPQLVAALRGQHEAIDRLFATLIAKTMHAEHPFYPSESGQPWEALLAGKAAIEAAGGSL